jgi:hypothetical protein
MVGAKKNECANALKGVKRLFKDFCYTSRILKNFVAEGLKKF